MFSNFQNLIPKIIKIWPETIVELLDWLSKQPASSANLLMYLMLARRARSAGLLDEGLEVNTEGSEVTTNMSKADTEGSGVITDGSDVDSNTTWCGVLSRQLITVALKSADSEVSDSEY